MNPSYGPSPQVPYSGPQGYYPAPAQRKEPVLSLLASFFIPGLGTILNGETGKGLGIMALYFLVPLAPLMIALFVSTIFIFLVGLVALGAWIWGLIDAYKGAQAYNARHGLL